MEKHIDTVSSETSSLDKSSLKVLDFFYDEGGSCALTVLHKNTRFHVIADAQNFGDAVAGTEYQKLMANVKQAEENEGITSLSTDCGVDLSEDFKAGSPSLAEAEDALHNWMLQPLHGRWADCATGKSEARQYTLREWYTLPTYFFNLEVGPDETQAVELQPDKDLQSRLDDLVPQITIPKYIRDIDVPAFTATDLTVRSCSSSPSPYHPTRVQSKKDSRVYFFKIVDPSQPQPTKREISLLNRITKKDLHHHIRCPRLEGLVTWDGDRSKIMGFLQTDIPQPTPLTLKLDINIPQELRDKWAAESRRIKDVLHDNDIVWGDAKADNFMVDKHDRLWIIDFGGSYTEGWIDPEIKETEKGDDMGVEKIVYALQDPVANVWDLDAEKNFGSGSGGEESECDRRKRKRAGGVNGKDDHGHNCEGQKRRKRKCDSAEEGVDHYCYCRSKASGRMIRCDNEACAREWFHFECIGLSDPPRASEEWLCDDCST